MKTGKKIYIVKFQNNFIQVFSTLELALKVMEENERLRIESSLVVKTIKSV